MRNVQRWEQGVFSEVRPLCFNHYPLQKRPVSFGFTDPTELQAPTEHRTARLYYRAGWTGLVLWNGDVYFAEHVLAFDAMMELVRSRFRDNLVLQDPIRRDYVD